MRIGLHIPVKDGMTAKDVMQKARMIEDAGYDSMWIGDSIGGGPKPDALMWLLVAGAATQRIELGTCVYVVPLHNPVVLTKNLLTLHQLTEGRFTFGVGTGSGQHAYDTIGRPDDFPNRFKLLNEQLKTIRALSNGEQVGPANLHPYESSKGGPPIVIGSWWSGPWMKQAAQVYEGWMTSASRTNFNNLQEAIVRFRDMGGKRALVANLMIDLTAPTRPMPNDEPEFPRGTGYNLQCERDEAIDRLGRLIDLGYDDVHIVHRDYQRRTRLYEDDLNQENLDEINEVVKAARGSKV